MGPTATARKRETAPAQPVGHVLPDARPAVNIAVVILPRSAI